MKIAIIGGGRILKKHLDACKFNNFDIVGITEINEEKNDYLQRQGFKTFYNIEDMLKEVNPDLVSILVETGKHFSVAKTCIELSFDVLIEKPLTLIPFEATELFNLASKNSCSAFVVKQNRFNPSVVEAKRIINKGGLGEINMVSSKVRWCRDQNYYDLADWRGTWKYDGGVLSNQASHHLDLVCNFLDEIDAVYATKRRFLVDIETEDSIFAILEDVSGRIANIEATTATRPVDKEGSITIMGSKGFIELGGFAANKILDFKTSTNYEIVSNSQEIDNVYGFGHRYVYKAIKDELLNNINSGLNININKNLIKILSSIYKSTEIKKRIKIKDQNYSNFLGI